MKQLEILCDVDEILANLLGSWLKYCTDTFKPEKPYTKDDMKIWGIEKCINQDPKEVYKGLDVPGIFLNLEPLPGALESLKRIHNKGHDICIVTASAKSPHIAGDKISWIRKYLPWLNQDNFFLGRRKYKLTGDVLIDDAPHNLIAYRNRWPSAHLLTIAYGYNESVKDLVNLYAQGYNDTVSAWKQIEEYIDRISKENDSHTMKLW